MNDNNLFKGCGLHALPLRTYHLIGRVCNYPTLAYEFAAGWRDEECRSQEVHEKVWNVLCRYRDVAVVIELIPARPSVVDFHNQCIIKFEQIITRNPTFYCGFCTLLHAIVCLHGRDIGR